MDTFLDNNRYITNSLPSVRDDRDWVASHIIKNSRNITLPSKFSLIDKLPAIRNQGNAGSCVAQSLATVKEYHENNDVGFESHMSPQFIYNQRPNKPEDGMFVRDALKICKNIGICPEKYFTYGSDAEITDDIKKIALNYTISSYAKVNTINDMKHAIFTYGPCIIVFPVYNKEKEMWNKKENETLIGYHCMAVVGWKKNSFIIRNSWGNLWGDAGYCNYNFSDWGKHVEAWMSIDANSKINKKDNINVSHCMNFIKLLADCVN